MVMRRHEAEDLTCRHHWIRPEQWTHLVQIPIYVTYKDSMKTLKEPACEGAMREGNPSPAPPSHVHDMLIE